MKQRLDVFRKITNPNKGMLMRLVLDDVLEVVMHNCEHPGAQGQGAMLSWAGCHAEFDRNFQLDTEAEYPETAR
jgi:hypothetical protein